MDRQSNGAERSATPGHLWVVGLIGLLWNGFGCYDYSMTRLSPESYLRAMGVGPEMVTFVAALPAWITGFWALGVWGSLAGSVLLLARSRHAVTAFALSLLGLAVSQGAQALAFQPPESPPLGLVGAVWAALLFFLAYAARMRRAGVLA